MATFQPGNLEGWLARITTNAFLDRVRKQKRRPTIPLPDDQERILVGSPDVDAQLAAQGLPDYLQQLLGTLSPEYRAAVVLADVIGYSYQDIAAILDIPIGTVRSRIHRGRSRLREALT